VRKSLAEWIDFLYGPIFRVIGFFYRSFTANRARFAALKANPSIAGFLKVLTVAILLAWILIWLFASEESRTRLTDEVRQSIGGFEVQPGDSQSDPGQPRD
jgi:hypothetical protein